MLGLLPCLASLEGLIYFVWEWFSLWITNEREDADQGKDRKGIGCKWNIAANDCDIW